MQLKIKGIEGEYIIFNNYNIVQYKIDTVGKQIGKSIKHVTTDSIENNEDRNKVFKVIMKNIY
ncbi:MAG: hypothetical protein CR986_00575 [Ignavibacteriae bacterium]|nr:MAG: hypothetical protein CR986_00575 [Ignavibacteriota bacterium]